MRWRLFSRYFMLLFMLLNTSPLPAATVATSAAKTAARAMVFETRQVLARYLANRAALKQNAVKQAELHTDIANTFNGIRQQRNAKKPTKEQGRCDACAEIVGDFCNRPALYPEFCKHEDCHVEPEPKVDVCWRIFQNEPCYKALTPGARAKVNDCWSVDNHLNVKELEVEIDNLKTQLDGLVQEQYDLMKYELVLEAQCPKYAKTRVPTSSMTTPESATADEVQIEQ